MKKPTPGRVIGALQVLAPCRIIHSTLELPKTDRAYGRRSRSRYFSRRGGRYPRTQGYILVNEGSARQWRYVTALAHEVGHALDDYGIHPAQHLFRSPRSRFRQELAGVSMELAVSKQVGYSRTKLGRRSDLLSMEYVNGYTRGKHPKLSVVLKAIPKDVLPLAGCAEHDFQSKGYSGDEEWVQCSRCGVVERRQRQRDWSAPYNFDPLDQLVGTGRRGT